MLHEHIHTQGPPRKSFLTVIQPPLLSATYLPISTGLLRIYVERNEEAGKVL